MSTTSLTDDQRLTVDVTRLLLADVAPDETEILDETAEEFFADPQAYLSAARREESLGSGLARGVLLTPYVLAALRPVVTFLLSTLGAAVQDEAKPRLRALLRRVFRLDPDEPPLTLTRSQARSLRDLALQELRQARLDDAQAAVIADALVGRITLAGE